MPYLPKNSYFEKARDQWGLRRRHFKNIGSTTFNFPIYLQLEKLVCPKLAFLLTNDVSIFSYYSKQRTDNMALQRVQGNS